jgi:hypothetical protein
VQAERPESDFQPWSRLVRAPSAQENNKISRKKNRESVVI